MPALIIDIETIGEDFDKMDEVTQKNLLKSVERSAKSKEEGEMLSKEMKDGLGLSPLTGEIVALGVLDSNTEQGAVYYQAPDEDHEDTESDGCKLKAMSEKEMLEKFWELAQKYDTFVTYNGRGFDIPYILIRSAVHNIRPTKDLMSNRYTSMQRGAKHVDLMDQLSFYGAVWKRPSLHLYCRAFGIESPKDGMCGSEVGQYFKDKKYLEIAKYNIGDIIATDKLYKHWVKYLRF